MKGEPDLQLKGIFILIWSNTTKASAPFTMIKGPGEFREVGG